MSDVAERFATAVARHQAGDLAAAERMYRAVLDADPAHPAALCNLGAVLVRTGKPDDAADCYRKALAGTPGYPDAHFNLGNLHRRAHRLADAEREYRACLAAVPDHPGAAFNLGLVYAAAGELGPAAEAFAVVARVEPKNPDAFMRLGDVFARQGRQTDAVANFRTALELKPDDPRALYNLGLALVNGGHTAEAQSKLHQALKLKPGYAEAHNALGLSLEAAGRKDDALFHYQQAVQFQPDFADGWSNLGTNMGEQGRSDEAIDCLRHSLSCRPDAPQIHSNLLLLLNYSGRYTPEEVRAEHVAWAARHAAGRGGEGEWGSGGEKPSGLDSPSPFLPLSPSRLRVGYLSADYRTHTVSGFLELLLRHHSREAVEVFAYASVLRPDAVTDKLKALADHWRPVGGLPDEKAAELIRADRLDVLVDLGGHTAGNRLLVMARRPAPVQATLFGYPNTTGMTAVDYRITDELSDPPGASDGYGTEKLLRLSGPAWAYLPPADAPPVGPLPAASQRGFVFGCLNNPAKVSDACLDAWAKILQTAAGSRLVLLAGHSQNGSKRMTDRFSKTGILRDRVQMLPRMPFSKYLAAHGPIDLALDPFPYNGGVTTCDALWMGVPVLAVAGNTYASRQGFMLMTRLGLGEFVADSPDQLVKLAKHWTLCRPALAEVRAELRGKLAASEICDGPKYCRSLEEAYRQAVAQRRG